LEDVLWHIEILPTHFLRSRGPAPLNGGACLGRNVGVRTALSFGKEVTTVGLTDEEVWSVGGPASLPAEIIDAERLGPGVLRERGDIVSECEELNHRYFKLVVTRS